MDKFLEKIQKDIDTKLIHCLNGDSIVKPFKKVFEEVRERKDKRIKKNSELSTPELSRYKQVIEDFLKSNPEFLIEQRNKEFI